MSMTQKSFLSLGPYGFHRIAYTDWQPVKRDDDGSTLTLCVHGLTRNGRDFDYLAKALAETRHVVCPDMAGRGHSDWLLNGVGYGYPLYASDCAALLAHLNYEDVDWIGTSMGGIIGMMLAALPNSPIKRLILNDVGPLIPATALERIAEYIGNDPDFSSLEVAEHYLRKVHASFGELSDAQWQHMAQHSTRRGKKHGHLSLHYDPAIANVFKVPEFEDVDLWAIWEQIKCPVLILRGENSDLLSADVAEEMLRRGPDAELVEIPGCGHAPALMDQAQIDIVKRWLNAD